VVISRRALLGTGVAAAAVAGALTVADMAHRLDNLARYAGVMPRARPEPQDDRLLVAVAGDQNIVLATVEATAAHHSGLRIDQFVAIGREHVEALGGSKTVPVAPAVPRATSAAVAALAKTYTTASKARAADAGRAISPDLARVLSSMSAGLAQCAHAVGALR
jgi:hypothetical protein